jgi:cell division protein FtsA
MSQRQDDLIVALDIGSASTRVLVAELYENALRYCGLGVAASAGMRKGMIAELGPAAKAVEAACKQAEFTSGINIGECVAGVGGPHIAGFNNSGSIELGSRMREIGNEDVRNAFERAQAVAWPTDRKVLHLLRREFILDDQPGIFDPVGMIGKRLEVDLHITTCSGSALQSTVNCANRAGLEVTETVLESIAAAEATLTGDERELGVCLVNIGSHSTDLIAFREGAVVHTASIRIGGQHFTNDLAIGLDLPIAQAEELKRAYGHAVVTDVSLGDEIELTKPRPRTLRRRALAEILEPRACELLQYVKQSLREGGVERDGMVDKAISGCVLTGGGAVLPGMLYTAESQLRLPARIGTPVRISHLPAELVHPEFSVAVGMILYTHRTRALRPVDSHSIGSKLRAVFAGSF